MENVPSVEWAITTPKNTENSRITGKVDNVCTSSCIKMTETLGIDNVFLKVKSSQRSISSQRSTILRTLRKKKQKFKPVNVGNKNQLLIIT